MTPITICIILLVILLLVVSVIGVVFGTEVYDLKDRLEALENATA